MNIETLKDMLPYLGGALTTVLAFKKDWIQSKFSKENNIIQVKVGVEDLEEKQLNNVEKEISIYKDLLDDVRLRHKQVVAELRDEIVEMKIELDDLRSVIDKQKTFIRQQSRSLSYYESKYGKEIL